MSAEKKTDFHIVNKSVPRRDGRVKVTGRAQYVADLKLIGRMPIFPASSVISAVCSSTPTDPVTVPSWAYRRSPAIAVI